MLLDYPTTVRPELEAEQARALHRDAMLTMLDSSATERVNTYRFGPFIEAINRHVELNPRGQLVIDITCLTKVHTIALAYWLLEHKSLPRTHIAYTRPRDYGSPIRKIWGKGSWTEVIVAPVSFEARRTSSRVIGVLVIGHEGDRMRLAADELQYDSGISIITGDADDHRLQLTAEAQNAFVLETSGSEIGHHCVGFFEADAVMELVKSKCEEARDSGAKLALYPFGPKPIVFACALSMSANYPEGSWYSYPVPRAYDYDYTSGHEQTYWSELR